MLFDKNSKLLKCQSKLFRFALSLTNDVNDAKDILQETMLKLLEKRNEWNRFENFEAYAMRSVRNTYLNDRKRLRNAMVIPMDTSLEFEGENEIEKKLNISDLRNDFNRIIAKLPEIQKQVLYLREIEEMEYKVISDVLNISEVQVKVYIYRGRQFIKKQRNEK